MSRESGWRGWLEDGELAGRERLHLAVLLEYAGAEVKLELAEADRLVFQRGSARGVARRTAAEHRMDAGKQFARVEGFGDVVVGAELKTDDAVDVLAAGGEHDDGRHVLGGAKAAQNLKAILPRHHQVENEGVEVLANPEAAHRGAVFAHEYLEAVFAEIAAQKVAKSGIVVNNENFGIAFHGGSPESASVANRNFGRDCRESRVGQ